MVIQNNSWQFVAQFLSKIQKTIFGNGEMKKDRRDKRRPDTDEQQ